MSVIIYGLVDPRDGAVRYVGKTVARLSDRLTDHISSARTKRDRHLPKSGWIAELLEAGLRPDAAVLEIVADDTDWQHREKHWIAHFRSIGSLLNVTHGGNGCSSLSDEAKAKVSAARKGVLKSEETKARMRAAQRGRTFSPEHRAKISATLKTRAMTNPEFAAHLALMSRMGSEVRWR